MIPDHHAELVELLAALNADDAVRACVAARLLSALLHRAAMKLKPEQAHDGYAAKEAEYRSKRLEITAGMLAPSTVGTIEDALEVADLIMAANASRPIPDGAIL